MNFQAGAGGTSLAFVYFMKQMMKEKGIKARSMIGGSTKFLVEMMEEGLTKCELALGTYATCETNKEWPNRPAMIHKLSYPSWYKPVRMEESIEDIF
jgi:citrate lyase alpha subunit